MNCPCMDCPERMPPCWSTCEAYLRWKEELRAAHDYLKPTEADNFTVKSVLRAKGYVKKAHYKGGEQ